MRNPPSINCSSFRMRPGLIVFLLLCFGPSACEAAGERARWLLVIGPVFVAAVVLIIYGLGRKKLRPPKDDEEDPKKDLTHIDVRPGTIRNQDGKQDGKRTEDLTGTADLRFPPPNKPTRTTSRSASLTRNTEESCSKNLPGAADQRFPPPSKPTRTSSHSASLTRNTKESCSEDLPGAADLRILPPSKPMRTSSRSVSLTRNTEVSCSEDLPGAAALRITPPSKPTRTSHRSASLTKNTEESCSVNVTEAEEPRNSKPRTSRSSRPSAEDTRDAPHSAVTHNAKEERKTPMQCNSEMSSPRERRPWIGGNSAVTHNAKEERKTPMQCNSEMSSPRERRPWIGGNSGNLPEAKIKMPQDQFHPEKSSMSSRSSSASTGNSRNSENVARPGSSQNVPREALERSSRSSSSSDPGDARHSGMVGHRFPESLELPSLQATGASPPNKFSAPVDEIRRLSQGKVGSERMSHTEESSYSHDEKSGKYYPPEKIRRREEEPNDQDVNQWSVIRKETERDNDVGEDTESSMRIREDLSSIEEPMAIDFSSNRQTVSHSLRDTGSSMRIREDLSSIEEPMAIDSSSNRQTVSHSLREDPVKLRFLQKLMALDVTARDTGFEDEDTLFELDKPEIEDFMEPSPSNASNPLDNLCEILRAADAFLQQEILTKMAMCQFGVPLLLPASNGSQCTFMLWAMREIVKKWTSPSCKNSKGFLEDNLVNVSMPIVSFAKLGTCSLSKSKLLNHVLSPPELTHDFFVYSDMPGGNIPRRCSDGLVEISWYFPVGQKQLDIFSDPVAILNLRGDLEVHFEQFNFLTRISSAMFVFIETLNEGQCELVSKIAAQNRDLFFILNFDKNQDKETLEFLKSLSGKFELKKETFLIKSKSINDSQMVKALQARIRMVTTDTSKKLSLEQIADRATECRFLVDENFGGCEKAKNAAMAISSRITNVSHYKKETMRLQEGFSKPLAKLEKELCRMRELGDQDVEEYKSQLQEKRVELRSQQRQQRPTHGIVQFLHIMRTFSKLETKVFLKWLKIQLDSLARHHLAGLNEEYRTKLKDPDLDAQELMKIDKKISDSSLGIEHFIRELGQMYELEHSLGKSKELKDLPGIAANLLLDGFPLELVDGDASNIPLQWISNVLTELDVITGGRCRMRVITILGVQSTGKSTLLNTMFGLQYPVASGRCTRGAFMTLLNAKNEFQEDLGCDYIMVIDTEGLKSMELASLEGSYEHDNELATLVVGLSDITIINMAMENTEEMKEILQIVVHAFLRMNEVGKKSSCHFVHQNVSDVSAHDKNRKARGKFLEQLNEMTKIAARMEKRSGVATFSDIIHCDIEKNSWYIPGLWYGIPPMACINLGYSDSIKELKRSVIGCLESMAGKPQNIPQFTEWVKSLWNAVKHEKFLFSFQNRMITEAYNQLCIQYSEWEWTFQKTIHEWMMRTETLIFNLPGYELGTKTWDRIREQMSRILDQEERVMSASLEQYYEHDCDNAHLLEMFRGDFIHSVAYLRKDLENTLLDKCERTIEIQKERCQIRTIQENYINIIETRVSDIMENIRKNQYRVNEDQLKKEFEMIWEKAVSNLPNNTVKMRDIDMAILQQLKRAMKIDDCSVANRLENTKNLHQYKEKNILKKEYLYDHFGTEWERAESLVSSLLEKCDKRVDEIASTKRDFSEVYSQELLKIIDDGLDRLNRHHPTTKIFELDLKLHILGKASVTFQKMHEDFVCCNDPRRSLEELKPQYFSMFKNTFEKRDESQRRAKQFCNICLMPAFVEHVNRYLGKEIVDDILQRNGPRELKSHKVLQLAVLKELLENGSPDGYEEYINNYESFIKQWISKKLNKHYEKLNTIFVLQARILQALISTIQRALYDPRVLHAKNISDFLEEFCNILKEDLVVPQNNLKVVVFQSGLNDTKQFAADVESYLAELEQQVKEEVRSRSVSTILSRLTLKPQDELFRKVMGCGQQCPFCKAPCEAGGADHQQHFASAHRPRGLARHMKEGTNVLDHSICSTNVISNKSFSSAETSWNPHLYKDYQQFYPNWTIHPDTGGNTSHYWKFVLKEFNDGFAQLYQAEPANVPKDWRKLTKERALQGLHL